MCPIHRCGPGGSMCTCHAAGLGSIPGRDMFPGWGFFGVFPHLSDKCWEALGPQGPRISFGHHYRHHTQFIMGTNDLRCWRALNLQYTYTWVEDCTCRWSMDPSYLTRKSFLSPPVIFTSANCEIHSITSAINLTTNYILVRLKMATCGPKLVSASA